MRTCRCGLSENGGSGNFQLFFLRYIFSEGYSAVIGICNFKVQRLMHNIISPIDMRVYSYMLALFASKLMVEF